jgi:tetratricopeptide (TPR) repeat protein
VTRPPGPFNPAAALQEALALHQRDQFAEAEKLYARVLKAQRDNFDALRLLGMLNHQRGKPGEAYRLISAALKVEPRSPDALSNLALVLQTLKRNDEALAALDKALTLAPGHIDALNLRGNMRAAIGDPDAALKDYDAALVAAPGHPLVLYNRGNALRALGRDADAIAAYDSALAAAPNHAGAWTNRGMALAALNRHVDAVSSYSRALTLNPDNADVHFNAGLSLLTLGDYRQGFAEYEWRWKRAGYPPRGDLKKPLWLGETLLSGKTILIHAEQGFGDTIMLARYAALLARSGARVVMQVQPELKGLLAGLDGAAAIVGHGEPLPPFDLHCPLTSLPFACKTEIAGVPVDIPYLRATDAQLEKWRPRLAGPLPRVALAWSGRATHANDRNRSLSLAQLEPLFEAEDVRFVSVQHEPRAADAERLAREPRIINLGAELADFTDTAAVLTLCELVICVDSAVAHLAGALGRPGFVLLPFQPDWRWTQDRAQSPWYPELRLFRQSAPGDWTGVLARVREELALLD